MMMNHLRALTERAEKEQEGMELQPKTKKLIARLQAADKHLAMAISGYGKVLGDLDDLVLDAENMKYVATTEATLGVGHALQMMIEAKGATVGSHEALMQFAINHKIAMACCNGK